MNSKTRPVAVLGGNRIPFARSNGAYAKASNQDMLTAALDGLVDRFELEGERLGEVAGGRRAQAQPRLQPDARVRARLEAGAETPAYDVQQACGTGLEAAILVANKIALGQIDSGIAGGVDTTSDAPIAVERGAARDPARGQPRQVEPGPGEGAGQGPPGHIVPEIPRNAEPRTGLSMGEHQAITAKEWGVTREEQDELAAASHQNLAAAYDRGFHDDLMTPYLGLERDENLRADSTAEKLAKLKPAFGGEDGTMTAGNSTPLTDGASVVLLAARSGRRSTTSSRWRASSTPRRPRSTTSAGRRAC